MNYIISRSGGFFGDNLLAALFVSILVDNGIPAVYHSSYKEILEIIEVPLWKGEDGIHWEFNYALENSWDGRSIIEKAIDNFKAKFLVNIISAKKKVPIKFINLPNIPQIDVTICSQTSSWTPYRNWPYFPQLKMELTKAGISWIDINENKLYNQELLNYVKKSRLYLGLETGTSHFVSAVAPQGLIIQSGYSNINFWSSYGYDHISLDCDCRNCFLQSGCKFNHICMKEISVQQVLDKIILKL